MKFSKSHEWVEINNNIATVGITNYGKMHLGDIMNIQLPEKGKEVSSGEEVGVIESNKAAIDFHSPLSGKIVNINESLLKDLKLLNLSPEKEGWLFTIKPSKLKEFDKLLSMQEYEKLVAE